MFYLWFGMDYKIAVRQIVIVSDCFKVNVLCLWFGMDYKIAVRQIVIVCDWL